MLTGFYSLAQNTITGTISGWNGKKIEIQSVFGEKTKTFDSTFTDASGHFRATIKNRLPGMYRLSWSKEGMVDLIWNHENIEFTATAVNPEDSLKIISSLENQFYQTFTRMDRLNQEKLQQIKQSKQHFTYY